MGLCIEPSQPLGVFRSQRGGVVGVDETKLKVERKSEPIYLFLWAARDVDTKEVLAFRASFTRSFPGR